MSNPLRLLRPLSLTALGGALALTGLAAPAGAQDCAIAASPHVITERQPDGSTIELFLRGSAFAHWYVDPNGFPVLRAEQGWYVFAEIDAQGRMVATDMRVGAVDPASAGLSANGVPTKLSNMGTPTGTHGLGSGTQFAQPSGTVSNLVLLLRFSDHGPSGQNRSLPSAAQIDTIMNAVGGDPSLAPTGSVSDHYLENSYNQFTFNSTAVGWLDLPQTEAYYTAGSSGLTTVTWELVNDGLVLADPLIDFSQFDGNADGQIDAITILHSGYGAEWGGSDQYGTDFSDRMWSHKWGIDPSWVSNEGVSVREYNISPGLWATSGSEPGRIGVVCHELGHFIGMPDLYDIDGSASGIGNWCLMAAGAWGFDGSQQLPSHMSAWCKTKLGWADSDPLLPGSYVAQPVEQNAEIFRVDSGFPPGEYLLIENRQQIGFDAALPAEGLAIWHIDETKGLMSFNDVNTAEGYPGQSGWPQNGNHYRVAMLQADGDYDMDMDAFNRGDSGDVYRSQTASSLTNATTPSSSAYQAGNLTASGVSLTGIQAQGSANFAFTYSNSAAPTIATSALATLAVGASSSQTLAASGGSGSLSWSEYVPDASYTATDLGQQSFPAGGQAQGWNENSGIWELALPFAFPYFETSYDTIWVSSNGYVDLVATEGTDDYNQQSHLAVTTRIAPLWDDLTTEFGGDDIFVDLTSPNRVRIRWEAQRPATGAPCNFALDLEKNGDVVFHYGSGNTTLSPTVGLSSGSSHGCLLVAGLDGAADLSNANSWRFKRLGSQLPAGLTLTSNGTVSGTPTVPGSYAFVARATDGDWVYDQQTISAEVIIDCNANGIADALDISAGSASDCNSNGIPDACEFSVTKFCTAKTDSNGCVPAIDWLGDPNSNGSFQITAANLLNAKPGILFYGFDAAAVPFLNGTLCAAPPLRRTPILFSAGNGGPADCSGTFTFDWSAWALSGADPFLTPGQQVDAQFWYRDPQNGDGTGSGLSDAVEFTAGC